MKSIYTILLFAGATCVSYAQATHQPFSITISAQKTDNKAGAPIAITVRLTDTSKQEINASSSWESGTDRGYEYDIRDSSGHLYERKTHTGPVSDSSKIQTLKPGESMEESTLVSEEFDLSRPGEYVVQLSRRIHGDPGDDGVKSNSITITVLPADDPPTTQKHAAPQR
jgi:hypothetical protein